MKAHFTEGVKVKKWKRAIQAVYSVPRLKIQPVVVIMHNNNHPSLNRPIRPATTHTHTYRLLTLIRTNASIVDVAVFKSISAILGK